MPGDGGIRDWRGPQHASRADFFGALALQANRPWRGSELIRCQQVHTDERGLTLKQRAREPRQVVASGDGLAPRGGDLVAGGFQRKLLLLHQCLRQLDSAGRSVLSVVEEFLLSLVVGTSCVQGALRRTHLIQLGRERRAIKHTRRSSEFSGHGARYWHSRLQAEALLRLGVELQTRRTVRSAFNARRGHDRRFRRGLAFALLAHFAIGEDEADHRNDDGQNNDNGPENMLHGLE